MAGIFLPRLKRAAFSILLLPLVLPNLLLAGTAGLGVVKNISYKNNTVTIYLDPAKNNVRPKYKYNTISNNRFYIDVLNSRIEKKLNFTPKIGNVKKIIRNQFDPTTSRVVLKLASSKVKPAVSYRSNPPRLIINTDGKKAVYTGKKYRILLDPGHGGWDTGAIGRNGTREKHVTMDIARELQQYLRTRDDVIVKMTRTSDKYISPSKRKSIAKKWNTDLFISIHANGSTQTHLNQTEIYYNDKKSYPLAKMIKKELVRELKQRDGGVRKKSLAVIRRNPAKYGSVLVESDYLTNRVGENRLRSSNYRQKIAKSIYDSIDDFLRSRQ